MMSEYRKTYTSRIEGRQGPFFGCFIQVAHFENNPPAPEPMYRVLRVIRDKETYAKARDFIAKRMKGHGNILFIRYGEPALIAKSAALQKDPEYVHKRIAEIETEWLACFREGEARSAKLLEYRRAGTDEAANKMFADHAAKYNQYGWVKYMKAKAGFTDTDMLEPGVRCEMPADHDAADEFAEEEESEVDLHTLPPRIVANDQKHVAVSVLVSNDDTMEAVVYVHDVLSEVGIEHRSRFESRLAAIGMLSSPAPVDVEDVGVWCMPVANMWMGEAEEQSWSNGDLNKLQQQRLKDARKQDAEKAQLIEQERQTDLARQELTRASKLDRELVDTICTTPEGCEALIAACKTSTKGAFEDAIEHCIELYGSGAAAAAP